MPSSEVQRLLKGTEEKWFQLMLILGSHWISKLETSKLHDSIKALISPIVASNISPVWLSSGFVTNTILPILGDPGVASWSNGIFMGESLQQERESPGAFTLTERVPEAFEILPSDWPENSFGQSEGRISNTFGTRSVRVNAQGLSCSCC